MEMILFEITPDSVFNYFASIFLNLTIVVAPIISALALLKN